MVTRVGLELLIASPAAVIITLFLPAGTLP